MSHEASAGYRARPRPQRARSFYDKEVQGIIWQVVILGIVFGTGYWLFANMQHNLHVRQIQTGFDFLGREAGYELGESLIAYSPASTYARAMLVGFLNTLHVAVIGVVLATLLGVFVGIGTLSRNWLVAKLTAGYIHFLRNIPVLLQIILWYSILISDRIFPGPRQAEPVLGTYFTQRGIYFPVPEPHFAWTLAAVGLIVGLVLAWIVARWAKARQEATGEQFPTLLALPVIVLGVPALFWLLGGAPTAMSWPGLRGFNLTGGQRITPEFTAVLFGLTIYTSAFIGEIVRSGILSVAKGQIEAARAIGLRESHILRLVTLPQALRVIIPPMTSQFLNLTKNSSLAVAVGYPDLVSAANTTLNQTGQSPEVILIIMIVYLTTSLTTSLFMNWYNKRIALVER